MEVAILGGWSLDDTANAAWGLRPADQGLFVEACRAVGERLAARGHSVVVGSDADNTADRHVVDGYLPVWESRPMPRPLITVLDGLHSDRPLFLEERRGPTTARLFAGRAASPGHPHPRAAEKLVAIRDADAVVAIGGLQDTYTAGVGALVAKKPLVPFATFGGAALELWNATRLLCERSAEPRRDADFDRLMDPIWTAAVLEAAFRFGRLDRPLVFLASAGKAADLAAQLCADVEALDLDVVHWSRDFRTSRLILDEIRLAAFSCKYAIVLLTPDDKLRVGATEGWRPRDNVLFELGYFANALGTDRVLAVVQPPTVVPADYGGFRYVSLPPSAPVSSILPELRRFFAEDISDRSGGG